MWDYNKWSGKIKRLKKKILVFKSEKDNDIIKMHVTTVIITMPAKP